MSKEREEKGIILDGSGNPINTNKKDKWDDKILKILKSSYSKILAITGGIVLIIANLSNVRVFINSIRADSNPLIIEIERIDDRIIDFTLRNRGEQTVLINSMSFIGENFRLESINSAYFERVLPSQVYKIHLPNKIGKYEYKYSLVEKIEPGEIERIQFLIVNGGGKNYLSQFRGTFNYNRTKKVYTKDYIFNFGLPPKNGIIMHDGQVLNSRELSLIRRKNLNLFDSLSQVKLIMSNDMEGIFRDNMIAE